MLQAVPVADPVPGVGYTVTKKTGNSPERSRIKRRLREAVRACSDRLGESLSEPFDNLTRELDKAIARLHRPTQAPSGHPKP